MTRFAKTFLISALTALLLVQAGPALAQESGDAPARELPGFGMEFEFAGRGNRIPNWENQNFDNFRNIMRVVAEHFGDNASAIDKELHKTQVRPDGTIRQLWRAIYVDPQGRKWRLEPEYVATGGLDGYELVTPPLAESNEIRQILTKVRDSGHVREGLKSGVHMHVDGKRLIAPNGNATALLNLINMHESMEPMLRRIFNPVRGGGHSNRFATPIFMEHPELLRKLNALPAEERTAENFQSIFAQHNAAEMRARGFDAMSEQALEKMWKYHSLNLVNLLAINEGLPPRIGTVEFRMFDLDVDDPRTHERAVEIYRNMVAKAVEMAARGEVFEWDAERMNPDRVPPGENPGRHLLPTDPLEVRSEARQFIEFLGLEPSRFETVLERNIRPFAAPEPAEFDRRLRMTPDGRVEIGGRPVTLGWELEGRGAHVVLLMRPNNAELDARWDGLSDAEKMAEFKATGENISEFKMDTGRFGPWLSGRIHREGTGNWEIESEPLENMREVFDRMRWVKKTMGGDGRGFHLHLRWAPEVDVMRNNSSQIADWFSRAADAIFLRRLEVMKHALSMNTAWNKRLDQATISQIEEAIRMGENTNEKARTIAWRPGGSGESRYLDIEIRGLWTRVNDIESVARMLINAFKNQNWGETRLHEGMLPFEERVAGRTLPELVAEWAEKVAGRRLTPAEMRALNNLSRHDSEWAKRMTQLMKAQFTRNMLTPLLGWENEQGLEETVRRQVDFAREDFNRQMLSLMDKVFDGRFGLDVNAVNRNALVNRFGLSEADADRLIEHRDRISSPNHFELNEASLEELRRLPGVGQGTIDRVRAFREAGNRFESEADFDRAGIRGQPREVLMEAMTRPTEGSRFIENLEELRTAGVSEEGVERLRSQGAFGENLNANEMFRAARNNVKTWAREALLADHMFRSLLPFEGADRQPNPRILELSRLSGENLEEVGVSREAVGMLERLRSTGEVVSVENLRNVPGNFSLDRATAAEIGSLEGVNQGDARRIVEAREFLQSPTQVDLNTASRERIMEIPGVNAEIADRIIEARESGTRFENGFSVNSLSGVSGLARRTLAAAVNPEGSHSRELTAEDLREIGSVRESAREAIERRLAENRSPIASADAEVLLRETNIPMTNESAETVRRGADWHENRTETMSEPTREAVRNAVRNAFPTFHWMRNTGAENLNIKVTGEAEPIAEARITDSRIGSEITISNGMLDKINEATEGLNAEEAKAFRSKAITLLALEAVNRATSMDINLENGARASGIFGSQLTRADADRLREMYDRMGRRAPAELERLASPRAAGANGRGGTGVIPENLRNENVRRVRDRARTRSRNRSRGR